MKLYPNHVGRAGVPALSGSFGLQALPLQRSQVPRVVRWSLLAYVFCLPYEAMTLPFLSGDLSLARIAGLTVVASCLFYRRRFVSGSTPALWWFAAYLAVILVRGQFISEIYGPRFFGYFATHLQLLILAWLVSKPLRDPEILKDVLVCFSVACSLLAVGSLLGLAGFAETREADGIERAGSFGNDPNFLGTMLALALIIVIGLFLEKKLASRALKIVVVGLSLFLPIGVVSTGSRTAVVALVAGIAIYVLPFGRMRSQSKKVAFAGGCLVMVIALVVSSPEISSRLTKSYESGDLSGRDKLAEEFMTMFAERPLVGWGSVEYRYELGFRKTGSIGEKDTHNLFMHLLLEAGFVGTFPFVAALLSCLHSLWRARKTDYGPICFTCFATLMIANLALNWASFKLLWLLVALAIASSHSGARRCLVIPCPTPRFRY